MEGKAIMYCGRKTLKNDRPNNNLKRVWNGPGAVVADIPGSQASNLLNHPDEFIDVTNLDAEQLAKKAAQVRAQSQEEIRSLSRTTGPGGAILLENATEEQLLSQLEKVRGIRGIADVVEPAVISAEKPGVEKPDDDAFIAEKVEEAMERIAEKGDADDLDENGIPTLEAMNRELTFPITHEEYLRALGEEPEAPAEVA